MLTEEWTIFLLLCSLIYNVYMQWLVSEHEETIESFNELVMQMAQELSELGSPNVTWRKVNEEG
jgi:hypothetical protein